MRYYFMRAYDGAAAAADEWGDRVRREGRQHMGRGGNQRTGNRAGGVDGVDDGADAERQRRLAALRALAGQNEPAPPKAPPPPRNAPAIQIQRPRGRRPAWQIIGMTLAALCIVVAGALVAARLFAPRLTSTSALMPDPLVSPLSRAGMGCVASMSWSPNGKRIAALMSTNPCGKSTGGTFLVLYDTTLAKPLKEIGLDPLVFSQALPQSVQQDPALMKDASVSYFSPVWSADSARVAVPAEGPVPSASPPVAADGSYAGDVFWALALVDAGAGSVRVIAPPALPFSTFTGDNSSYNPDSYQPALAWRFDLTAGTGTLLSLPQALAYTWGADGALIPTAPLPATDGAPAEVAVAGSPWQAFSIFPTPTACSAPLYDVILSGSLWSPDGRYVAPQLYAYGRLADAQIVVPTPTPEGGDGSAGTCSPQDQANAAQDRARLAPLTMPSGVTDALGEIVSPGTYGGLAGLFSPAGKRLAIRPQGVQFIPWVARIYEVATDTPRAVITYKLLGTNPNLRDAPETIMAWSPDGARLLLADDHALYLLGARSLGR